MRAGVSALVASALVAIAFVAPPGSAASTTPVPGLLNVGGRVLGPGGQGLAGVTVDVFEWQGGTLSGDSFREVTSDDGGNYVAGPLENGEFSIEFSKPGYRTTWLGGGTSAPTSPDQSNSVTMTDSAPDGTLAADTTMQAQSDPDLGAHAGQNLGYCEQNALPRNDDSSSSEVQLPFSLSFYGHAYSSLYVNNNGNVTFGHSESEYTPQGLSSLQVPMIAPFFADVDTRGADSNVVTYGASPDGKTFCVDWADVGYYSNGTDKLNTFQLLLTSQSGQPGRDDGDFDITFNYDKVLWEAGNASGGSDGLGGTSAAAGYTAGLGAAGTFFQLDGSLVNGALLDSGPDALVAHERGSTTPGRYIFEIRNADANVLLGSIGGTVTKTADDSTVPGAAVQACLSGGICFFTQTGADGTYSIAGVPVGDYTVTVFPPSGSTLFSGSGSATVTQGATATADVSLDSPRPLPQHATITNVGVSSDGIPTVYWQDTYTFTTDGPAGADCTYRVTFDDGHPAVSGPLHEDTPGHFSADIPQFYPAHGSAHFTVACTGGASTPDNDGYTFDIYIDPSGTVVDAVTHQPIHGATVQLLRADTLAGPFTAVPDGDSIMSPGNRANPSTTPADGTFGWDVVAGYYEIRASAPGYATATSDPLTIPPAVTGLEMDLTPNAPPPPPPPAAVPFASAPAPTVSGTTEVGQVLTANPGTWNPAPSFSYQWFAGDDPIAGATSPTLTLSTDQLGKQVYVRVTGTKSGYETTTRTSPSTTAVTAVFATAPAPTIAGSAVVGRTLAAVPGTWSPTAAFDYQWKVDGTAVPGATSSTYLVPAADIGKTITVTVTGFATNYTPLSRTSPATSAVLGVFTASPRPTITGAARVDHTLHAHAGAWHPAAGFAYQWYANGVAISGATSRTLHLDGSELHEHITVRVTATRSGYQTRSRTSHRTAAVRRA